ncbi:sigma-54-dependent transcriptional regulator [Desulfoferrobacter suflitae]|uniref:sigma-54-dependent transcriptional regulator n=1 Tax=Desulfoferrobacter suflitae TaxID=2865782 RepID=UPI00216475AF|nr:sigma-54 dependent transcriptional regulator [Desulfoferrobacter suflitae]MCK8602073.1 sigma-54 dependent transcriptional regulator [Desulfoferrobacter suflitae]
MACVLLVEDDEALRITQSLYLEQEGLDVIAVASRTDARQALERHRFEVVVTDLRLGEENGLDVMRDVRQLQAAAEILVITGYGSVATAVAAMKEGAYDYLTKPVDPEYLVRAINKARECRGLRQQVEHLQERFAGALGLDRIVAQSPSMQQVIETIHDVAKTEATVLIEGESGTGKELMAHLIHERSKRSQGPFLAVNCGAMPEDLLESELFGHMRGSFTGAHRNQKGLFEAADGGTLFLDEIAETSQNFQVKLLRTLQERSIRRVGDPREVPVDVRVIAATNQDLTRLVREGRFRRDLFFRVKVIPIYIPPLRERREDVLALAEHFLVRLSNRMGRRRPPRLTETAQKRLTEHTWPGNVRELENSLERALIINKGDEIDIQDLFLEDCLPLQSRDANPTESLQLSLAEMEKRHILNVLSHCRQNKTKAAEILGIGYNTLWRKLKKYGVEHNKDALGQDGQTR